MHVGIPPGLVCVPLNSQLHDRESFSSGHPELDRFLSQRAGQAQKRSESQTFVLVPSASDPQQAKKPVFGYVTLVLTEVRISEEGRAVPALLLARMAVDRRHQGNRYGQALVEFTFDQAISISNLAGCAFVVVDPKDGVDEFYRRMGFTPFLPGGSRHAITLKQIRSRIRGTAPGP